MKIINLISKINRQNKNIELSKTFFYKFIKLKRSDSNVSILKNLQILTLLNLFFLEKNKFQNLKKHLKKHFFAKKVRILHKKTTYLKKIEFFSILNPNYLPPMSSKRFLRWTLFYQKRRWFKVKLWKINNYLAKKSLKIKGRWVNKRDYFFLTKEAVFSKISLFRKSLYRLKKRILTRKYKAFFCRNFIKKITLHKKRKKIENRISEISKFLSNWMSKILISKKLLTWIKKFKKKIFTLEFKIPSFFYIHNHEFFVPYQVLYFRKSILNFSNSKYLVLPTKNLMINNLEIIKKFLFEKFNNMGVNTINFINLTFNEKWDLGYGFKFFNLKRLEKVIIPVILFFNQFKRSYLLDLIYFYIDTFFFKKKFLPSNLRKLISRLLGQAFNIRSSESIIEDTYDNQVITLVFYKFLSEIFNLIFTFSPGEITFLDSKPWKNLFNYQLDEININGKNWEYLNYYSKNFFRFKRYRFRPVIHTENKSIFKHTYFYFNFFLKRKIYIFEKTKLFLWKKKKLPVLQNISNYLARNYFPIDFIRNQIFWRMFFMWVHVKTRWFKNWIDFGKIKVTYDSFLNLQNKFWPEFFFSKTHYERVLIYGFTFRTGQCDFNLDWNFLVGYTGQLSFWLKWKKPIFINNRKFFREKIALGYFSAMKHNQFFSSFFSFLNWSYLLEYYLQFGHTKSNYNTSYKDYLIMIYNERFIINLLNSQLNLKWNFRLMFKMFYLGGFICLVGAFNILLEGLVNIYGAYSSQPYTWFIWINGLFSNFDKIFWSIQLKIADGYAGRVFFSRKMIRKLIRLWFCMKGILKNLSIDISFFPSLYNSSWVFLEACARFYPTITTANTETFLPTVFLEYSTVANDYSLLSLSLYINLLLVLFKRSKILRQVEFSVYPQKLLGLTYPYKIFSFHTNIKHYRLIRHIKIVMAFIKRSGMFFFDVEKDKIADVFKYLFIYRKQILHLYWKQNFWKFLFFKKTNFNTFQYF